MRNKMQKSYFQGDAVAGSRYRRGQEKRVKSSDRHPYLKASFWSNPVNHFWENANYSEAGKEYFRNWLRTSSF